MNSDFTLINLLQNPDASLWAETFINTIKDHPEWALNKEYMITWFSNAIMSGYDYSANQSINTIHNDDHLDYTISFS